MSLADRCDRETLAPLYCDEHSAGLRATADDQPHVKDLGRAAHKEEA